MNQASIERLTNALLKAFGDKQKDYTFTNMIKVLDVIRDAGFVIKEKVEPNSSTVPCPTCGSPCNVSWSGLELVANSGDERAATKHYTPVNWQVGPTLQEIKQEEQHVLEHCRDLIVHGHSIQALKIFKDYYGCGVTEAANRLGITSNR